MKKKTKKKSNNKKIFIVSGIIALLVISLIVRSIYLKWKDKQNRAWQDEFGITDEENPEGLTYEEFNESLPPEHRQEPGMREYLNDCPFSKAHLNDDYAMDIFKTKGVSCDRKTHKQSVKIILKNKDFEAGKQEFMDWLDKHDLVYGKDVEVVAFLPWNYEEVCDTPNRKHVIETLLNDFPCLSDLDIICEVSQNYEVTEVYNFIVKRDYPLEECRLQVQKALRNFESNEIANFNYEK